MKTKTKIKRLKKPIQKKLLKKDGSVSSDSRTSRRAALARVMKMKGDVVVPDKPSFIPHADVSKLEAEVEAGYIEMTIGALLEQARSTRKLGKRELSRKLGSNHARISQLEGAENLELKSILQVLDSLDYDLELRLIPRHDGEVIRARV